MVTYWAVCEDVTEPVMQIKGPRFDSKKEALKFANKLNHNKSEFFHYGAYEVSEYWTKPELVVTIKS